MCLWIHVLYTRVCKCVCLKIRREPQVSFTGCCLHFSGVSITGVCTKLLVQVLGTNLDPYAYMELYQVTSLSRPKTG